MRILFIAPIHHPEQLRAAREATPAGETPPLFPPSVAQFFWEKALRKRGHTLAAFYRTDPVIGGGERTTTRHTQGMTPGKLVNAALGRIPPRLNPDLRLRNTRLIEQARAFRPDLVWMVGDNNVIYPETLAQIKRETGTKIVYFCGTSPIIFCPAIDRAAARLYDLVISTDYYHGIQWRELGAPRMVNMPIVACDPDFHKPYPLSDAERQQYACDIAFVGTLTPDHLYSHRVRALEALRDFDIGIWSVHEVPPSLRRFARGKALGEQTMRILGAAKIGVNTHGDFALWGGNIRLFETAAAGIFQITDDRPGVRDWFTPGENIVTYSDEDDLREKVAYYLAHDDERTRIAAAGQAHVYSAHSYDVRAAELERLVAEL
ncbi:MAG: glycosyltransferase [Anaerolineae bacterium]|nr:glycosyltransferase [Anaerolineae bacterium]